MRWGGGASNVNVADSFLFFRPSITCFYDFAEKARHSRPLQLHILQPAWMLRRSRGAGCKYFPPLRSHRKAAFQPPIMAEDNS